jgi:hypothetical protein
MIKIFAVLAAVTAGVIFYFIGKGIGLWLLNVLKDSGGMVTATETIECVYILPVTIAIIAAYIAYKLSTVIK